MSNEPGKYPQSVDEAVKVLLSTLSIEDKRRISRMSEDNLISLHFGFGMRIRSEFGLWEGNEALIESCRVKAGKDNLHIDDASSVIIKALCEWLKKYPPPKLVRQGPTPEY